MIAAHRSFETDLIFLVKPSSYPESPLHWCIFIMKLTTKTATLAFAIATLATTSLPALANTVDLRVIGAVTPTSCTPTLAGGGTIDYGSIPPSSLSSTAYTVLSAKTTQLAIACDAPAKIAIKAINGRPNTLAGATEGVAGFGTSPIELLGVANFGVAGLGKDGDDNIGGFTVRVIEADNLADSNSVISLYREGTPGWELAGPSRGFFSNNVTREITWAATGTTAPVEFRNFSTNLEIQAYINKTSELDMTKPINLDGQITIELVYL